MIGARIDFREEAKPKHCHALLQHGLGLELRQLDEGEVQTIDYLLAVLVVYDLVVVDEGIGHVTLEDGIDEVEGIYWFESIVILSRGGLRHIELGGIEEYSLLEGVAPFHLHLHAELSAIDVLAEHVHDGVLVLV